MIGGAQISNLTVKPAVAKPGQPIDVSYAANGDHGYVRLQGRDGTIWTHQAFARNDETWFSAPPVSGTHADTARAASSASNAPAIAGDNDPGSAATDSDASGTFEVLGHAVKGGNPIHVRILSQRHAD